MLWFPLSDSDVRERKERRGRRSTPTVVTRRSSSRESCRRQLGREKFGKVDSKDLKVS